jgi:hypothetical protein
MGETPRFSRRRFLQLGCRSLASGLLLTTLSSLYGVFAEPRWLRRVHVDIFVPSLPSAHDGLKIGLLSDLHVSSAADLALVERAVGFLRDASPDLVALTGDFVTHEAAYGAVVAKALADLCAPYGTYAVLGNHDVWTDADHVADALSQRDISVLRDDRVRLTIADTPLWLLGVEDRGHTGFSSLRYNGDFSTFQRHWQDAKQTMTSLLADLPSGDPRLLLVHNPDFAEMLPPGGIDLTLSGHTHGGQVRFPLIGAPFVPSCFGQTFVSGHVQATQTQVYVNPGVGAVPPAVRFNSRPEVTVLRLTRTKA